MARPVARRYTHVYPDRDPLSLAVAAVANWLTDVRFDLQFTVGRQTKERS